MQLQSGTGPNGEICIAKNRSSLGLERAEKLIAVSSAAKLRYKDKKPADEKEMELLCHSVIEDDFGTALVDSVLVLDP